MNNTPACKMTFKKNFPCANYSMAVARNLLVTLLLVCILFLMGCSGTKKLTGGSDTFYEKIGYGKRSHWSFWKKDV